MLIYMSLTKRVIAFYFLRTQVSMSMRVIPCQGMYACAPHYFHELFITSLGAISLSRDLVKVA